MFKLPRQATRWLQWLLGLGALWLAAGVIAQPDPPARVGRIAEISGTVWVFDHDQGEWTAAVRNRPVTGGDRLSTGNNARVELRIGSTILRLAERTELEMLRLDDERLQFQLQTGSAALRVRSREIAEEVEFITPEARFRPLRAGHYRFDRQDDISSATTLSGELLLDGAVAFPIANGQRMEFWRERGQGGERTLRHRWASLAQDELSAWLAHEDRLEQRSASTRYVSPEMTGAEDLDRYGRWDRHPEYGPIWVPLSVTIGWVPYRYGHWAWVRPWGWTWVDEQPWGFAPFHYGRWVHFRGQWCWTPGGYVARPAFSPALVAWIGGPHVGVGIHIGPRRPLPGSSWVPLAPGDVYVPHYRASPRWADRINREPWQRDSSHRPPDRRTPNPPTGTAMFGNQGVPHAVTPVSRDVLAPRLPHGGGSPPPREWPRHEPNPAARVVPTHPVAPASPALPVPAAPMALPPPPTAAVTQPTPQPQIDNGSHRRPPQQRGGPQEQQGRPSAPATWSAPPTAPAIVRQPPAAPAGAHQAPAVVPPVPAAPAVVHQAPPALPSHRAAPIPQAPTPAVVQAPAAPAAATPPTGRQPHQRQDRDAREAREEREAPRMRTPESRSHSRGREALP